MILIAYHSSVSYKVERARARSGALTEGFRLPTLSGMLRERDDFEWFTGARLGTVLPPKMFLGAGFGFGGQLAL